MQNYKMLPTKVNITNIDNRYSNYIDHSYDHVDVPNKCPLCHHAISPDIISAYTDTNNMIIVARCTACKEFYISRYKAKYKKHGGNTADSWEGYEYIDSAPSNTETLKFSDKIANLSPDFIKIYKEAKIAEDYGLLTVCGPGYRKAVEFLITDYLKAKGKLDDQTIPLAQKINKIDNAKVKNLATACAWLGNDETHVLKKHADKDINDLKKFIEAFQHMIEIELISDDAGILVSAT